MQLDKKALGLTFGVLWGGAVFLATWVVLVRGGGEHLRLIRQIYLGYEVSALGSLIGLVWGFVDGFIGGWLVAWLYNKLASRGSTA